MNGDYQFIEIKFKVGPVDLHWGVYENGVCLGEARKMYGATGQGNDGFRWDLTRPIHAQVWGYEPTLAKAIGRVLIGKEDNDEA